MFIFIFLLVIAYWVISPVSLYNKSKFNEEIINYNDNQNKTFLMKFGRYFLIYIYYRIDRVISIFLILAVLEFIYRTV